MSDGQSEAELTGPDSCNCGHGRHTVAEHDLAMQVAELMLDGGSREDVQRLVAEWRKQQDAAR
jgi:hypothetical protein